MNCRPPWIALALATLFILLATGLSPNCAGIFSNRTIVGVFRNRLFYFNVVDGKFFDERNNWKQIHHNLTTAHRETEWVNKTHEVEIMRVIPVSHDMVAMIYIYTMQDNPDKPPKNRTRGQLQMEYLILRDPIPELKFANPEIFKNFIPLEKEWLEDAILFKDVELLNKGAGRLQAQDNGYLSCHSSFSDKFRGLRLHTNDRTFEILEPVNEVYRIQVQPIQYRFKVKHKDQEECEFGVVKRDEAIHADKLETRIEFSHVFAMPVNVCYSGQELEENFGSRGPLPPKWNRSVNYNLLYGIMMGGVALTLAFVAAVLGFAWFLFKEKKRKTEDDEKAEKAPPRPRSPTADKGSNPPPSYHF
ncbi:hypothetical protein L596_022770 [Steinernema carpocapsae]|uniref:Uncharacterized protein n=1 Tax=Steinernema carpocapsae TaxID=34508 RepID=A0A4U5MP75_STECR|nr:hypothetical protein L596_022770 [Steinernema carpocapsae]